MTRPANRLLTMARVIAALMLREMITRYGQSRAGYVWAVVEPAAFIGLLSLLFSQLAQQPPLGKSFPLFYASGYIAFHWVHEISNICARSVHVNRPLLAFPAVRPVDTILARFLLQTLTGLVIGVLILTAILAVFAERVVISPAPLLIAWTLAALMALGIGLVNCWLFALSKSWEVIWGVISRPVFLISCVFFTFDSLPTFAREALWWNPIVHVVGLVRQGLYPTYHGGHVSLEYLLVITVGLIFIGLSAMRLAAARLVSP
ncbi:MAG: ABC transporter permease [Pseudomonadota bacterium]